MKTKGLSDAGDLSQTDARVLVQELRAHQIELEMQNEELHRAQAQAQGAQREVTDIATRKHAQETLQAAHDELERRVEERTAELQRSNLRLAQEIEERKGAEEDVAERLRFETLLADLSSKFVNLPASEVDREIEGAIRRVCEFIGIDLAVLWQWSGTAPDVAVPTHVYFAEVGLQSLEPIRQDDYPWYVKQLLMGRTIAFSSPEELPAEAAVDLQRGRLLGIKSSLCFPLLVGGDPPVGALALNTLRKQREWPDELVKRLQLVVQVFSNALARKRTEEALRTNETRLEAGTELAGLGYYEFDFGERTCFLDERFHEICGVTAGQHQGIEPLEFWVEHLHPDDRPQVLESRQRLQDGRLDRISIEYRYLHPTDGQKWIHHLSGVATRNAGGRAVRTFGVVRDITEAKRLSERLDSAAEEWQTTFDSITDLIMILNAEHRIVRVNAATVRFFGLPMERIVGSVCWTLMHGTTCPIDRCPCQATFQTRQTERLEVFHAGSGKWLLLSTDPIRDRAGKVTGAVHVGRDITESKRAEAALRASEEISRVTFEQAAVGIAHVGMNGRWLRVNDKLCATLGYERDELMRLRFQDLTHPDDLEADLNSLHQIVSGEIKTDSREKRYIRKDGSILWAILTVSLVRSISGAPLHFISVLEDITERKLAESALHDLSGRLISAQEQERARLARELHDGLNQNLALLVVELELLAQRPPASVVEISTRLQELSAQIKKLASEVHRISHDLHPAKLTQLGLTAAMNELCHSVFSVHQIPVSFDHSRIPHGLPLSLALCLYRVAQESLQNVVKHSQARHVQLQLTVINNVICLSVADDGSGFAVGSTRTNGALGLVSMRERVRLVDGQIRIASKPGEGTRVSVRIPLPEGTKA